MKILVYTLNAFTKNGKGGNPAGVVLNSHSLTRKQMLLISKKVGFAETAFVSKSNKADFKVKFFTPSNEVDLCGHASIATFSLLHKLKMIGNGKYTQETKAGILNIEVNNEIVFMNQMLPKFYNVLDKAEIADSLNISEDVLSKNSPIQIVSTGLKDILIPIKSLKDLHSIKPNFKKVSEISKKYDVIGYHLFTLQTKQKTIAHCRNLAPLYDVPEEAAMGTSNGALSCYLFQHKKINPKSGDVLIYEQGYSMKQSSEILAKVTIKNKKITEVKVGGTAGNMRKRMIEIEM